MMMVHRMPITQARRVKTGISGSSVLDTADRTSGYGESPSANSVNGKEWSTV